MVLLAAGRAVHFAATAMVMGTALFQCLVAEPAFRTAAVGDAAGLRAYRVWLATIVWIGLAVAILSGAAWLLTLAAKIGGKIPSLPPAAWPGTLADRHPVRARVDPPG